MLLCADIGNSRIKFGVFNKDSHAPLKTFSISSLTPRTSDELFLLISQMLADDAQYIERCAVCSVVPDITYSISVAMEKLCGHSSYIIGAGTRTGFPIRIENQTQLGADLVANTAGALQKSSGPIIIADFGTATTVTAVNSKNELLGTVIVPGIQTSLKALNNSTALISGVGIQKPNGVIGKSTEDSVTLGVIKGAALMADGFVRSMKEEICKADEKPALICTGGHAPLVIKNCRYKFENIEHLTLMGTAHLFYKNVK